MITFSEYLQEGRDAPLYHYTSEKNFQDIFLSNRINASSMHNHATMNDLIGEKPFVSLSRNPNNKFIISHVRSVHSAGNDEVIILQLSQRKLAQSYKIIPFDFFSSEQRSTGASEDEEAIIGSIKNLNKYLERIYMSKSAYNTYLYISDKYPDSLKSGIAHVYPIYDIKNRNKRLN